MNILITLPKNLIEKIISGEKVYEMRKSLPKLMKIGEDGFFAVEKGTSNVRCWCRVDDVREVYINDPNESWLLQRLCVDEDYIRKYAANKKVYLWKIGKVITFKYIKRDSLFIDKNPQQFAYCPLSYRKNYL
jgi:hypothetical protein